MPQTGGAGSCVCSGHRSIRVDFRGCAHGSQTLKQPFSSENKKPVLRWASFCKEVSGGWIPCPAGLRASLSLSSPGRNHGHWDLLGLQPGQLVPSLLPKIQFPSPWWQDNQWDLVPRLQLQVMALQLGPATPPAPQGPSWTDCIIPSSQ